MAKARLWHRRSWRGRRFSKGLYVQAFPQFGVERRGAPVLAFARLSETPIRIRTHVYNPHHVMVLDQALIDHVDVTTGLHDDGWIIINSSLPPRAFDLHEHGISPLSTPPRLRRRTESEPKRTDREYNHGRCTGTGHGRRRARASRQAIGETIPKRAENNQDATREAFEKVRHEHPVRRPGFFGHLTV